VKLYELTNQFAALSRLVDDPDTPEGALTDSLEGIEGEIELKAEALLQVVTNMGSDVCSIDDEIARLNHRKAVIANRQQSLKDYLRHNMQASGISKISCPLFDITLTKPRPMAVVQDEALVPDEYVESKVVRRVKRDRVLAALKNGKDIPGCVLGESAPGLVIK
jgi:hypothetical protein